MVAKQHQVHSSSVWAQDVPAVMSVNSVILSSSPNVSVAVSGIQSSYLGMPPPTTFKSMFGLVGSLTHTRPVNLQRYLPSDIQQLVPNKGRYDVLSATGLSPAQAMTALMLLQHPLETPFMMPL